MQGPDPPPAPSKAAEDIFTRKVVVAIPSTAERDDTASGHEERRDCRAEINALIAFHAVSPAKVPIPTGANFGAEGACGVRRGPSRHSVTRSRDLRAKRDDSWCLQGVCADSACSVRSFKSSAEPLHIAGFWLFFGVSGVS